MNFPDQPYLHQLQQDLWQWPSSRAAVMVGAGFSLNTEPLVGVSSRFPTWRQLVWAMFEELHPLCGDETTSELQSRNDEFSGCNSLRLASEYEAAFGRHRLDLLIRRKNPDDEHNPGILHELLLQLPWKDVFTTNYDTLLERTQISGRAYQPVFVTNDLTTKFSPRIIKLHGSFPSHTPFILTEEDYRTYPSQYAPFVNTVQQALIENSLVLVGFSGDDPNFLQWIGWIRDHLGDNHSPIYLVGPLSLSNAQRTLLERRGVTSIDLSPLFSGRSPSNGIHAASLEWFFKSLMAAKPQRPEMWGDDTTPPRSPSDSSPPITCRPTTSEPENIDLAPKQGRKLEDSDVFKVVSRWKHEREMYPGWIVAPNSKRSNLWLKTRYWIHPILQGISDWPPAERILVLRELNWRYETAMVPLFPESIEPIERTVDDLYEILKSGKTAYVAAEDFPFQNVSHEEIVDAWLGLAFGILREARETFNASRWNHIKEKVDQIVKSSSKEEDRSVYEDILWRISNMERLKAKDALGRWSPSPNALLASMWKASLLAELDDLGESRTILRSTLRNIRYALLHQGQNIELLSLEGWCTYLLFAVECALDFGTRPTIRQEFQARWTELKAWNCDPWTIKEYFDESLSMDAPKKQKNGRTIIRGFDPSERTISNHWSGDGISSLLPAFAYIRFFEQAGIPLRMRFLNISGDALQAACKWVAPFIGYWSPAILVRAGKVKELKNYDFMRRTGVAAMNNELAQRLHDWGIESLSREIKLLSGQIEQGSPQESYLEGLPEIISRLSFKVNEAAVEQSFHLALRYHRAPGIRSHIRLHEACKPWFKRIFTAASDKQLLDWLPDLIRSPFVDESTQSVIPPRHVWPDPMDHFPSGRGRAAGKEHPELLSKIEMATDWLLKRGESEIGEARRRTLMRLRSVFHADLMTNEQKSSFGETMWSNVADDALPDLPLVSFSYFHLPYPETVDVVSRVHDKILRLTPQKSASINPDGNISFTQSFYEEPMISEAAMATKPLIQLAEEPKGIVEWTREEAKSLLGKAMDWWNNDKALLGNKPNGIFDGMGSDFVITTLDRLDLFLARAVLPYMDGVTAEEWNEIFNFIDDVHQHGCFLATCFPYILLHRPEKKKELEAMLIGRLGQDEEDAIDASSLAVRHWIHLASEDLIDAPGPDLLRTLVNRVVFRRPSGVQSCIRQVSLLLIVQPESFSSSFIQLLLESLKPWHEALRLPVVDGTGGFPEEERPDLRALLGMLAGALSQWVTLNNPDAEEPVSIKLWRDTCMEDPLPEVSRSFVTWKTLSVDSAE